mmetsp:Transcript_18735/g.51475  ORF Transcript_18735/g.51475 Transcript_18735/m.51475 type:complete len:333 (-) Transcript_18735:136-1134(-)
MMANDLSSSRFELSKRPILPASGDRSEASAFGFCSAVRDAMRTRNASWAEPDGMCVSQRNARTRNNTERQRKATRRGDVWSKPGIKNRCTSPPYSRSSNSLCAGDTKLSRVPCKTRAGTKDSAACARGDTSYMSKPALLLIVRRMKGSTAVTSREGRYNFDQQISLISCTRSANGLSATTPASVGSRAASISTAPAPMEKPQRAMRVKPRTSRRCLTTHARSSRSKKPSDTYFPSLIPEPAKSKHMRPILRGSRNLTREKPSSLLDPLPWQYTTQARSSLSASSRLRKQGSKSVQTRRTPWSFLMSKSERCTETEGRSEGPIEKWGPFGKLR